MNQKGVLLVIKIVATEYKFVSRVPSAGHMPLNLIFHLIGKAYLQVESQGF